MPWESQEQSQEAGAKGTLAKFTLGCERLRRAPGSSCPDRHPRARATRRGHFHPRDWTAHRCLASLGHLPETLPGRGARGGPGSLTSASELLCMSAWPLGQQCYPQIHAVFEPTRCSSESAQCSRLPGGSCARKPQLLALGRRPASEIVTLGGGRQPGAAVSHVCAMWK